MSTCFWLLSLVVNFCFFILVIQQPLFFFLHLMTFVEINAEINCIYLVTLKLSNSQHYLINLIKKNSKQSTVNSQQSQFITWIQKMGKRGGVKIDTCKSNYLLIINSIIQIIKQFDSFGKLIIGE